jgi:hypothetical protein
MNVDLKNESKIWIVYFIAIICSIYLHETGHCIPAWLHGFRAIPTPAKEYISGDISPDLKQVISLGGIIGSVLFSVIVMLMFLFASFRYSLSLLSAAIAVPGVYSLRFILQGRGHDSTEFQEAQSALGLSYSGHSLDWFFLALFICGAIIWIIKSKPKFSITGRLLIGFVVTLIFVIALQKFNNDLFDPIFLSK